MKDSSILVIDDELELLTMIRSIFEQAGFTQITTAASGKEALEVLKQNACYGYIGCDAA